MKKGLCDEQIWRIKTLDCGLWAPRCSVHVENLHISWALLPTQKTEGRVQNGVLRAWRSAFIGPIAFLLVQ